MRTVVAIIAFMLVASAVWAISSPPVTSTVNVILPSGGGGAPVITGALIRKQTPVSGTIGSVAVAGGVTSCTLAAGGMNTSGFSVAAANNNSCVISNSAGLTGGGNTYLNITATNGSGTSAATPVAIAWRAWNTNTLNVISGNINLIVPSSAAPLTAGTIMGRAGSDSAANPSANNNGTSCSVTGDVRFTGTASPRDYHCLIKVANGQSLTTSGTATLTVTLTNSSGTGSAGTINLSWTILSSGVPLVTQQACSATTAVAAGQALCTVSATNAPTSCALSGDPGQYAQRWFSIAPSGNTCVISATATLAAKGAASLGSPLLYVTATNGSGQSLGNYAVIALGPSSACINATDQSCIDAKAAGYTNLTLNEGFSQSEFDLTDSSLPGFHWYGMGHNNTGPINFCDVHGLVTTVCNWGSGVSLFDTVFNKDQDGDTTGALPLYSFTGSNPTTFNILGTAGGISMRSCATGGVEPYNVFQLPVANIGNAEWVGQAFANGFYLDSIEFIAPTDIGASGGSGIFTHGIQGEDDTYLQSPNSVLPQSNIVEYDQVDSNAGGALNYENWNSGFNGSPAFTIYFPSTNYPTGAFHHFQELWIPAAQGGGTGTLKWYVDGALKASTTYSSSNNQQIGLDTQFNCFFIEGSNANNTASWQTFQIWQHP